MSNPNHPAIYLPPPPATEAPPEETCPVRPPEAERDDAPAARGEEWNAYSLDILTAFFDA